MKGAGTNSGETSVVNKFNDPCGGSFHAHAFEVFVLVSWFPRIVLLHCLRACYIDHHYHQPAAHCWTGIEIEYEYP